MENSTTSKYRNRTIENGQQACRPHCPMPKQSTINKLLVYAAMVPAKNGDKAALQPGFVPV